MSNVINLASEPQALLKAALALGLPCFPCAATKVPAIAGGRGLHDASADPKVIRRLFADQAARLIGVPCGPASGFDALDIDPRHGGEAWLAEHAHRLPDTRVHRTPSGGRHYLFKAHPGLRNSAGRIGPGCDARATGGYVCWPGAGGYSVLQDIDIANLPPWPDWLLALALRPEPSAPRPAPTGPFEPISDRRLQAYIARQLQAVRAAVDGQKHERLRNAARAIGGVAAQAGLGDDAAIEQLLQALPSARDWSAARATALWGLTEGRKQPLVLEDRPNPRARPARRAPDLGDWGEEPEPHPGPVEEAPPPTPLYVVQDNAEAAPAALPLIEVTPGKLHDLATAAEDAILQAEADIFQRGWTLVRPIRSEVPATRDRTTLTAGLGKITAPSMLDTLSRVAQWMQLDRKKKPERIDPPKRVVEVLLSREGLWRLPRVRGVITAPSMRWDGSVLTEPGFDPTTCLYHMADPGIRLLPTVDNPTRRDAEDALQVLQALLVEFPFVSGASQSVALSAILSVVARGALEAVPLHLFRAATPGTGKSYLADVVSAITNGRPCPAFAWKSDQVEAEKGLTSLLLAGFPLISIDNVNGQLSGDLLSQAIERPIVQVRRLGVSEIFEIMNAVTLLSTGNNTVVVGDLTRRVVIADMDRQEEQPELHQFKGDPVATVLADRSRYLSAALTILRAYRLAKGTPPKPKTLNSFRDWSDLVRAALIWIGCPDPVETMQSTRDSDPVLAQLGETLHAWHAAFDTASRSVAEVVKVLDATRPDPDTGRATPDFLHADLREVLHRHFGERGAVNTRKLGNWLTQNKGRLVNGMRFMMMPTKGHNNVAAWRIEVIKRN